MSDNMLADIQGKLTTGGLTNITYGDEPDSPIVITILHEYAGRPPGRTHHTRTSKPGLQVVARANDWTAARARLQAVEDIIDGLENTIIGGTDYISIMSIQGIAPLGWSKEAYGRVIRLAQNYEVERAR